jgi:hypothetical protein
VLGLRRVGRSGRPTHALGGSSGYQGRAGSHWFSTAASRTARSPAALMAGGGGLLGCSGAQGRKGRGVLQARRGGSVSRRGLQETPAWARSSGDVRRGRQPMGRGGSPAGECASAAWHRPRPPRKHHGHLVHSVSGAGLEPLGLPAPWRARAGRVRRGRRGGARATSCAGTPAVQTVSFSLLPTEFSPNI